MAVETPSAAQPASAAGPPPGDAWLGELLPALRRLDVLIERAVAARGQDEPDPYAGLFVTCDDVGRLLARGPGEPLATTGQVAPALEPGARLAWLEREFALSPFDVDVLVIALAPELDLRYERLYAFLQDDVTRRRPTVDLALGLLCASADARLRRRARFAPQAPLIASGLVRLVADPAQADQPLLSYALRPDDQAVRMLLGDPSLDGRLAGVARVHSPVAGSDGPRAADLAARVSRAVSRGEAVRLFLHGPDDGGRRAICAAVASALGAPLVDADLSRALGDEGEVHESVAAALREARLRGAVLVLEHADALPQYARRALAHGLDGIGGVVVMSGDVPWPEDDGIDAAAIACPLPDFATRRACWSAGLAGARVGVEAEDLDALAERFRLPPERIARAVRGAVRDATWRGRRPAPSDLFAAARAQAGGRLSALASKVETVQDWDELVLPPDRIDQLHEICLRATYRHVVHEDWGFERRLALGRGLNVLFSGTPGTGKTMAASVIASELGLELYKIDLSQVVSKYIGETEKNLGRLFADARASSAILFFDEADALFGSRSEVRDAHDRYANIETGYLLQKMDEYDGIVVLATNLRHNIDEAFLRRLHVVVEFPFPDEESRRRIWEVALPDAAPLAGDVDHAVLARHAVPGGSIRNIAVSAAFDAAASGGEIGMARLEAAARREFRKLGRTPVERAWETA